ncbi:MAG TPA: MaoC family dehydratase N-terminal domain-containing protein [Actinomycetota bacterium]|nr:MaoC family dehydratase N-terminal domain-containing protein [Actinomycetota bacterium]
MTIADADVKDWVGKTLDAGPGDVVVEQGLIQHWCEATENGNPLFWDDEVAEDLTGGPIAPPTMLSVWMRPLMWKPGPDDDSIRPLELHFQLKDAFDLPEGVVANNELEFHAPVRPGDLISTKQSVREISEVKETRLGTGRFWTIDVTYTNQRGETVGVESYAMFSYRRENSP